MTKKRILIVEDDPLIRALLADRLRMSGYAIIEVATADEAMTAMSSGWEVHLVFSDVGLPGTMGGFTFAMWMRDHHPAIPMVLSSGVPHMIPTLSKQDVAQRLARRIADYVRVGNG